MVHVAYKGGGPAATAVLAGEAQVIFGSVAVVAAARESRATESAGHYRHPALQGGARAADYRGIRLSRVRRPLVVSLLVTAGTSIAIVNRIHDAVMRVMGMPDIQEAMARQGLEPETSTPENWRANQGETAVGWAGIGESGADAGMRPGRE